MTIVSPIQSLPSEILSEVFIRGLPDPSEFRNAHPSCAPLLFRQVSRHWRTVSSSTPELWNTLYLDVGQLIDSGADLERFEDLGGGHYIAAQIIEWLSRAQSLPVDVTITGISHYMSGPDILYGVVPFASQLRKLVLSAPYHHLMALFDPPVSGGYPILEVLEFRYPEVANREVAEVFISTFNHSHRLRSVTLGAVDTGVQTGGFIIDVFAFSWGRLTELRLEEYNPEENFKHLLDFAVNLRTFSLSISFFSHPNTLQDCRHSNIRDFKIDGRSHQISAVISALTLPALQRLDISGRCDLMALVHLQDRSKFPLEILRISGSEDTDLESSIQFLQCVPSLTRLHVIFPDRNDRAEFLQAISYQPSDGSMLLPRLEHLEVYFYQKVQRVQHGALVDMLKARWQLHQSSAHARLKEVTVRIHHILEPDVLKQLNEFRKEGLVIKILMYNSRE